MTALKKELKKSAAKATAAAQADETSALKSAAITAKKTTSAKKSQAKTSASAPNPKTGRKTAQSKSAAPKAKKAVPAPKHAKTIAKKASAAKPRKETGLKDLPEEKSPRVLDSEVAYEGPLFRVLRDHFIDPAGRESRRDVIRHNGSVVILAVDHGSEEARKKEKKKNKKDPWIVMERQYRHAAGQYLWELPAGKLDPGEDPIVGAKRELAEETGYAAEKWTPLIEYYASPGFLGEAMKVFLAEGLVAGDAHPEEDEHIDFRLVRISEVLEMVDKGKIIDGKTLTSVLLFARQLGIKQKK